MIRSGNVGPDLLTSHRSLRNSPKQAIGFRSTNVAVAANGDFYVADGYGSSYIDKYDKRGHYTATFGGKSTGAKSELSTLDEPHHLIIDNRGQTPTLRVTDCDNGREQRFSLDARPLDIVGSPSGRINLDEPTGGGRLGLACNDC